MSVEVETDADTGEEIVCFVRRGRRVLMLRDRVTKRFIKRLIGVEQRVFMVVDYSKEQARRGNPLYLDAVGVQVLTPDMFVERDRYMEILKNLLSKKVGEYFGGYVVDELLTEAGVEYGSELRHISTADVNLWYWSLVWKHSKEEEARSREGYDRK